MPGRNASAAKPRLTTDGHGSNAHAAVAPSTAAPITITLSSGIVLGVRPVTQAMTRARQIEIERPEPPMWHNDQRDEDEPNPNHPDYLEAMRQYAVDVYAAAASVSKVLGTFAISVPPGYYMPDDDRWLEEARYVGADPDVSSPIARYESWLDYHAIRNREDEVTIVMKPLMLASLTEEEVDRTVDSFLGKAPWGTDPDSAAAEPGDDRHLGAGLVPGTGGGDRGEGSGEVQRGDVDGVAGAPAPRKIRRRSSLPPASTHRDAQRGRGEHGDGAAAEAGAGTGEA